MILTHPNSTLTPHIARFDVKYVSLFRPVMILMVGALIAEGLGFGLCWKAYNTDDTYLDCDVLDSHSRGKLFSWSLVVVCGLIAVFVIFYYCLGYLHSEIKKRYVKGGLLGDVDLGDGDSE